MDLLTYSDNVATHPSMYDVQNSSQSFWLNAYNIIGNESRTDPTVAAVLSQIVLLTDEFSTAVEQRNLDPTDDSHREVILVRRSKWGEYVLLVADDSFDESRFSGEETLLLSEASLTQALWKWQQALKDQPRRNSVAEERLLYTYRKLSPAELTGIDWFTVYFVKRPRRIKTSAPTPAWELTSTGINGLATAGCIVEHTGDQRTGVTSVLHFFPAGAATGTSVKIDDAPGTVADEDLMTDSVFIHVPSLPAATALRGIKGWLKGVAPSLNTVATFDGATSHTIQTAVQGHDQNILRYSAYSQAKVYTPPVTNPGDSGAALFEDSSDRIIGFAHERTEAGALIEWSSWIWADSVFTALNVIPK